MSEKILIVPGDVRGLGNIVSPKTSSDFDVSDSVLTSTSETVDGKTLTVYNLGYRGGTYFTITSSHFVVYSDSLSSITLGAFLKKRSDDGVLSGTSVSCIVNEDTILTGTTAGSGGVTFSIPYDGTVNVFNIRLKYDGNASFGGCTSYFRVIVGTRTGISLVGSRSVIETGDNMNLIATVTGTIDGEPVPLPYQTVNIYEEYTPTKVTVFASPHLINLGDETTITAMVHDSDGSKIQGETVSIYFDLPYEPVATDILLTADKTVISKADNEKSILSATVVDQYGLNMGSGLSVSLKKNGTLLTTLTTDDNGSVSYEYTGTGAGDVTISAECESLTETYSIEDCNYYNTNEVSQTTTQGSTIYDSNLSQTLPNKCEISYDFYSNNSNTSGEHRFFLLPKSQYSSGTTQPSYALYLDQKGGNKGNIGKREDGSSVGILTGFTLQVDEYHTLKYVKDGTSVSTYIDGTLMDTSTYSWIDNYTDYTVSMIRWSSSGTSKVKNVKFKPL